MEVSTGHTGGPDLVTKKEAATLDQVKAWEGFVAAATPLIQQVMDATRAAKREDNEHELKLAELEARSTDRLQRRAFPLIWFGIIVVTGLLAWAAYAGKWEIVTHALTAIIAGAIGYALRRPAEHHISGVAD